MKFESAAQRGSTCTWRWSGHARAGGLAEVDADVDAVGPVRRLHRPHRVGARPAHSSAASSGSRSSSSATARLRQHHQVARRRTGRG